MCVKGAHFLTQKVPVFLRFLALFLESAETPLFVQINVFAVWALRLDRKYTRRGIRPEFRKIVLKDQDFHFCYRTPGPQKVCEEVSEGVSFEWVLKGLSRRTLPLQNAFKNPSETFQEGDDALGFPGLKDQFQGPGVPRNPTFVMASLAVEIS